MSERTRLIVTRRAGEAVVIGGIVVVRLGATKRQVKLCIEAPREVSVVREELLIDQQPERWGP